MMNEIMNTTFSNYKELENTRKEINNTYLEIKETERKQKILGTILAGSTVVYGLWTVAIIKQILNK